MQIWWNLGFWCFSPFFWNQWFSSIIISSGGNTVPYRVSIQMVPSCVLRYFIFWLCCSRKNSHYKLFSNDNLPCKTTFCWSLTAEEQFFRKMRSEFFLFFVRCFFTRNPSAVLVLLFHAVLIADFITLAHTFTKALVFQHPSYPVGYILTIQLERPPGD